jgi:hypothetical protein
MAETVLKPEREDYGIERPLRQAYRDVFLRLGEPIELGRSVASSLRKAQAVCDEVAEQLRDETQALINTIRDAPTNAQLGGSNAIRLSRINFAAVPRVNRPPAALRRILAKCGIKLRNLFVF